MAENITPETAAEAPETVDEIPVIAADNVPEFAKPEFMVVGNTFIAQTEKGELHLPMQLPTKLIRQMPPMSDDVAMLYYVTAITPAIGEKLDELDIIDTRIIALKYFTALEQKQQARLGESRRSSRS